MLTERIEVAERYLTRNQVAEQLQVSVRTVDRYIADGLLAATKLPGDRLVRISSTAVDALLDPNSTPADSSPVESAGVSSRSAA